MQKNELIIKAEGISKHFGGIKALDNVRLEIRKGEVHAVVGENGAGKSTLMNIFGGIVKRDQGSVLYKGREVNFEEPIESISAGIGIIHQELAMLPDLNVIENVFMGRMNSRLGCVLWKEMEQKTSELLGEVGLEINPYTLVNDLSISQRQLVEIAKALSLETSLIIMDEPNSSLTEVETERLFQVIEDLKKKDISIIYVSHKIEEVLHISDRITVLRDGHYIGTVDREKTSLEQLIRMMVGRELKREAKRSRVQEAETVLEVQNLTGERFKKVNFTVRKGEIVGFAGLVGAGRSEVARAIFGADSFISGEILLDGKPVRFSSPAEAIKHGLAMLPEDRKKLSLFIELSIHLNMSLVELANFSTAGIINQSKVDREMNNFIDILDIKLGSLDAPVSSLSGGNQQKIVLSRWLATNPRLLILDEPTHGIDVGAKAEIYKLMRSLTQKGISIILISSELPEIMSMADRVVVMREGSVTGIMDHEEMSEDAIMGCATYNVQQSEDWLDQ